MNTAIIVVSVPIIVCIMILMRKKLPTNRVGNDNNNDITRLRDNNTRLRDNNACLVDDNRKKTETLRRLCEGIEGLLCHDLDHTLECVDELSDKEFFMDGRSLLDDIDSFTDWSTLEALQETIKHAKEVANE